MLLLILQLGAGGIITRGGVGGVEALLVLRRGGGSWGSFMEGGTLGGTFWWEFSGKMWEVAWCICNCWWTACSTFRIFCIFGRAFTILVKNLRNNINQYHVQHQQVVQLTRQELNWKIPFTATMLWCAAVVVRCSFPRDSDLELLGL